MSDTVALDKVIETAEAWLQNYGEVEDYGDERFMTQLDHSGEEYEERIAFVVALREWLGL